MNLYCSFWLHRLVLSGYRLCRVAGFRVDSGLPVMSESALLACSSQAPIEGADMSPFTSLTAKL